MRTERDFIGEVSLPEDALYGINAYRAAQNFRNNTTFSFEWYKAMGMVKQACYQTAVSFIKAAEKKYPGKALPRGCEDVSLMELLFDTAVEVSEGKYFDQFIIPAVQGGAGTAINMNINEIITNASLIKKGLKPGSYDTIDPFIHANIFQSTNDVVPTALRVAMMRQLNLLEVQINSLRSAFEKHETSNRKNIRIGYTQLQQAVPSSFGLLFSAWSDALSRDWWRVSKCFERIKVSNLGGGATGTAMAVPRYFVMEVNNHLRELTGLPITRSENHTDTTQNLDSFVEVHAILKAHAVNLEKISSDIRLLASDLMGKHELRLPQKQTGSSIMPGKVNPIINEFIISCSHKVYSNDMMISHLCAQGQLELNAYLPQIGDALLNSLHLLISANDSMLHHLINELQIQPGTAYDNLISSPSITTALLPFLGYQKSSLMAHKMKNENLTIWQANEQLQLMDNELLKRALLPENLLKLGYSLNEL